MINPQEEGDDDLERPHLPSMRSHLKRSDTSASPRALRKPKNKNDVPFYLNQPPFKEVWKLGSIISSFSSEHPSDGNALHTALFASQSSPSSEKAGVLDLLAFQRVDLL
jgi:hypothetical protein